VFEDLAVKQQVLREVEQVLPHDGVFASNTSTIPITRIAEGGARPGARDRDAFLLARREECRCSK